MAGGVRQEIDREVEVEDKTDSRKLTSALCRKLTQKYDPGLSYFSSPASSFQFTSAFTHDNVLPGKGYCDVIPETLARLRLDGILSRQDSSHDTE